MIIDAHTHFLGGDPFTAAGRFITILDQAGVDKAIVFTLAGFTGDYRMGNRELARFVARFPHRLYPFLTVHPEDGNRAIDEIKRARDEYAMPGIKLHPWLQGYSPLNAKTFPIIETAVKFGMPLVFHDGTPPYTGPLEFGHLAGIYPEASIILGHAGLRDLWPEALRAAKLHSNIILTVCGVTSFALETIIRVIGPERVIFGSDYPFGGKERLVYSLLQIDALNLPSPEKKKVLGQNIAGFIPALN